MVPVAGTLTLPDVLLGVAHLRLRPSDFAPLRRSMLAVEIVLRASAHFFMLYVADLLMLYVAGFSVALLPAIGVIVAVPLPAAVLLGYSC